MEAPAALASVAPQWSPPLKGGSTMLEEVRKWARAEAAMEPAVERREHITPTHHGAPCTAAAMEPAVERREHLDNADGALSPGNAAMEPAVERREHRPDPPSGRGRHHRRNGARR